MESSLPDAAADPGLARSLARIADALERLAPPPPAPEAFAHAAAFAWRPGAGGLTPARTRAPPLDLMRGIDAQKEALLANTRVFARGGAANNALLWGARGAGKSALVRSVHAAVAAEAPDLKIVAVAPEHAYDVAALLAAARMAQARVILFVDDLAFSGDEAALKALKPALDGGLAGADGAVVVYATSNRRSVVARDAAAEADGAFGQDLAEERLALLDRFGLRLGFHAMDEATYLEIAQGYAHALGLPIPPEALTARARDFARRRGGRSGRAAWQLILGLAGEHGLEIPF